MTTNRPQNRRQGSYAGNWLLSYAIPGLIGTGLWAATGSMGVAVTGTIVAFILFLVMVSKASRS